MENPREDVKEVVLALLDKPTLNRQAQAVSKYCTPDVLFYYLFFNVQGTEAMTVIYQIAQVTKHPDIHAPPHPLLVHTGCNI